MVNQVLQMVAHRYICSMEVRQMLGRLQWVLRIGLAMTFFGHGWTAWGLPPSWLGYLVCVGVPEALASVILQAIALQDLVIAGLLLVRINKPLLLWVVFWLLLVSVIRPICGESLLELVKRGGYLACAGSLLYLRLKTSVSTADAPDA
jgi:hypothetical protein